MDKELEIAIMISAMISAGNSYNDKDLYMLYESGNVAEIAKRVYESLISKGYCIQKIKPLVGAIKQVIPNSL